MFHAQPQEDQTEQNAEDKIRDVVIKSMKHHSPLFQIMPHVVECAHILTRGLLMRLILILALQSLLCFQAFSQAKGSSSYTFKATYVDTYIFRGHVYNPDATAIGELGIGIGKWSYNLFYADPLEDGEIGQLDFGPELAHNISYTVLSGRKIIIYGYQFFDYEKGRPDTQEIYTRIAHNTKWSPTYGIAFDIDTYRGYYLDFALTRFWPLTRHSKLVMNLSGGGAIDMDEETRTEGGTRGNPGDIIVTEPAFYEDDGITHGSLQAKYLWQPNNRFKVEMGADYHYAFDDLLYDDVITEQDNLVWRATFTLFLP